MSTQDDSELPREPVRLDLPAVLRQVLQRDEQRVRVKHNVSYSTFIGSNSCRPAVLVSLRKVLVLEDP